MIYQEYWGKEGLWFLSQVSGPTGSSLKGRGSAHLLEKRKNARRWRATSTCGRYAADALHLLNTFLLHTSGRYSAECRVSPATQGTRGSNEWCDTPVCVHPVTPPPPSPSLLVSLRFISQHGAGCVWTPQIPWRETGCGTWTGPTPVTSRTCSLWRSTGPFITKFYG